jgi:phosphatidylglycerol lysyltransferase
MTLRSLRRVAALLALASGVSTIVSAATKHPRHAGFLGVEWATNAVIGGRYGLLVCGVALIVLTRGLLHGKRTAQRLALLAALGAAVGHHFRGLDVLALAALAAMVLALSLGRRAFRAASDPARARHSWWILVAGETTVLTYGIVGLYLLDNEFRRSSTVVDSVTAGLRLLFLLPVSTVAPATRHGAFFIDSVRAASFAVVMAGVIGLVATVVARTQPALGDRRTIEELLDSRATIALAWFFLSDDKNWWFAADRSAVLAYKVVGSTAVVLGEPIGSPEGCRAATISFLEFCDGNGWTVGFHQVTEQGRAALAQCGLRSLKIGESGVLPVTGFDLSGHERKPLRSALRRLERTGYRVVELPHPIDAATMTALRAVSDAWLSSGGHRERTFTLGRFDSDYLQATAVLALVDGDCRIVAFVNMLPSYRSTIGNFDLMRRLPDAPNGAMDALFAAMIERCRAQGLLGLDLGLAPFANVEENTIAGRTLRAIYQRGGSAFNFEGLRAYKQKWNPVWEARYICYETEADLPKLAAAITRAGELPDPRSPIGRARGFARRFPVAISITTIVAYVMAATQLDSDLHSQLIRHFGVGWHDLVHLQLWRIITSPFVQDRPGFVWGNLLVLIPALFVAEYLFRSKVATAIFVLGDGLSTLGVLVGARLAGALGSDIAMRAALRRDGGSSAAGLALVAGCVSCIPGERARKASVLAILAVLTVLLVVRRGEADIEHLVAAIFGAGIVRLTLRRRPDS